MLDLNDFFYFVQVVDRGGFTAAGRTLRIPKSTLIPLPHQGELGWYRNDSWRFVAMMASIQAAMEAVSYGREVNVDCHYRRGRDPHPIGATGSTTRRSP